MRTLNNTEAMQIVGKGIILPSIGALILTTLYEIPCQYGRDFCDYYTGWDPVYGWNTPPINAPLDAVDKPGQVGLVGECLGT